MGQDGIERWYGAETRAKIYELLALGFSPPSEELMELLKEGEILFLWLDQREVRTLQAFTPAELIPEYHRLFVGPAGLPAPPYESVYREDWRVMGESTVDVMRQYAEAGYTLVPTFKDLPDHVAAELAFMALLAEEESKAWRGEDASAALLWLGRERAFLESHLTRWLPAFCDRLLTSTEAPFYRGLATALWDFVRVDLERIKALTTLLEEALA